MKSGAVSVQLIACPCGDPGLATAEADARAVTFGEGFVTWKRHALIAKLYEHESQDWHERAVRPVAMLQLVRT